MGQPNGLVESSRHTIECMEGIVAYECPIIDEVAKTFTLDIIHINAKEDEKKNIFKNRLSH